MKRVKVGIIGCGMISEIYLENMTAQFDNVLEAYACADVNDEAAKNRARQFNITAMSVDELLDDPNVELVLNLTVPNAHYEISRRALLAGKHAYSEKPLATSLKEGEELVALAKAKNLFVAAGPDTFLGGGIQTSRKLIEDGVIGKPVSAQGIMIARGPESFHPNPEFFYKDGAGPLLDMGPYYLTALSSIFGAAKRVAGMGKVTYPTRRVLSEKSPRFGEEFPCEVDTFVSACIEFENDVIANLTTSWDMCYPYWKSEMPLLTVFGSEGTLIMPDPNTFGGISESPSAEPGTYVKVRRGMEEFKDVPIEYGYIKNSRCLGVADMAWCIRNGGTPRVNGENSLHVLEMILGIIKSGNEGIYYETQVKYEQPIPLYHNVLFEK